MRGSVRTRLFPVGALLLALGSCRGSPDPDAAAATIAASDLARLTRTLSADQFDGRGPDSPGETATLRFLQAELARVGAQPMGDRLDGGARGWLQRVPVARITVDPGSAALRVPRTAGEAGARRGHDLRYGDDFVIWTRHEEPTIDIAAPLVFVGYGVVAPEESWNDYSRSVRGAIVIALINDPPGAERFGGPAMTYYGRWTYKFEEAARQGAAGVLLIHQTAAAGYGWEVVRSSWSGPQFSLPTADGEAQPARLEGWISQATADTLLAAVGLDSAAAMAAAAEPGFQPIGLGITAQVHLDNELARIGSHNLIAGVPGRSAEAADETVLWTAHWDHLGHDPALPGDGIYNGALDNATGLAALLEIAEAFASLGRPTRRSHLFVATTLEEKGLLGAAYYAANPMVPPGQTVAAINIDGLNVWGPTEDLTVIGLGSSELDAYLARALAPSGRTLTADPEPEKGFYYRSDHFPLAKAGIPALYVDAGVRFIGRPDGYGHQVRERYTTLRYHRPGDEFDPSWDFSGAEQDTRALFRVGFDLAEGRDWPSWTADSEFRAARAASRPR